MHLLYRRHPKISYASIASNPSIAVGRSRYPMEGDGRGAWGWELR